MFGNNLAVVLSGSPLIIAPGVPMYDEYRVTGSGTMSGSSTIAFSGTPTLNMQFKLYWDATLIFGAGTTFTAFGRSLNADEISKPSIMTFTYNGSTWDCTIEFTMSDLPLGISGNETITLTASIGAVLLDPAINSVVQIVDGSPTLFAPVSIAATGTPVKGNKFIVIYKAAPTLGGNTITIFGTVLDDIQATSGNLVVITEYDGSAWQTVVMQPDTYKLLGDPTDTTASWLSNKVQKSIAVDTSTHCAELVNDQASPGNNYVYGTDATGTKNWIPMSGLLNATVILTNADVLAWNSTPFQLVANPGSGKAIDPVSIVVSIYGSGGTPTPYATNTTIIAYSGTFGTSDLFQETFSLTQTTDKAFKADQLNAGELVANAPLMSSIPIGNPTGGAAGNTVKINVAYRIIDI